MLRDIDAIHFDEQTTINIQDTVYSIKHTHEAMQDPRNAKSMLATSVSCVFTTGDNALFRAT